MHGLHWICRVVTGQGKNTFSRSGKNQGILLWVRKNWYFDGKVWGNLMPIWRLEETFGVTDLHNIFAENFDGEFVENALVFVNVIE